MAKQILSPSPLLVILFLHCTTTLAQSPAQSPAQTPTQTPPPSPPQVPPPSPPQAAPPSPPQAAPPTPPQAPSQAPPPAAPSGPTEVTDILKKAGQFSTFIRLLKSTHQEDEVFQQLNNTNNGVTIFAPTDSAFGNLTSGTLNSLTDEQKVELMKFHTISTYIPDSQFQIVSNPIVTQAGSSSRLALDVVMSGTQANLTTGIVNATIGPKIYGDGQLAMYQLDQVLLPYDIYGPPAPVSAPALAPSKPLKTPSSASASGSDVTSANTSGATMVLIHSLPNAIFFLVSVTAAFAMS